MIKAKIISRNKAQELCLSASPAGTLLAEQYCIAALGKGMPCSMGVALP